MISVIFATRDDEVRLATALAALVPAATEGIVCEAIVVDAGSRDGTLAVADAAGCMILAGSGSESLRGAALAARGEWLLFLSPASVLEKDWTAEVIAFVDEAILAGEARDSAATFRLGRVESGWRARRFEWIAALRSRVFAAPYAEQGLLVPRALYRQLGGHRSLPAMADVDLARRIGRRRLTVLRARALVRSRDARPAGLWRSARNAACLALFVLRMPPGLIGRLAA